MHVLTLYHTTYPFPPPFTVVPKVSQESEIYQDNDCVKVSSSSYSMYVCHVGYCYAHACNMHANVTCM